MSSSRNNYQQKEDTSDRGRNLTSSTQSVFSRQQPQSGQRQQLQDKQTKKKHRGNRKLQRFRAKLRKRGLNNETITTLINDYNNTHQGQNEEQSIVSDMNVEVLVPVRDQVGAKSQNNELFYFLLKITGNIRKHYC
jgi:hypothetical protein